MQIYLLVVPSVLFILSACGKDSGGGTSVPGPDNTSLGLQPSDCGEHVWEKYFNFLGSPGTGSLQGGVWSGRSISISTSSANGKSTTTENFSNDPRCLSLDRVLSTGLGTWQSDTTFQVPGDLETIQKGVHILWRFKVELLTNEDLPKKLEDYTPGMLDGSQPLEVKEVKSMLDVGMGRALSDYYSGSSGPRPIEISCKKPFTYKFSFEDSSDANGVCRKKAGSSQSECLVAGIAFTGDQCIVKGTDIEILDKSGKLIKFGFEGILSNGRHDSGEQNYSLAISTVKLK